MIIRIPEHHVSGLLAAPESGMGWQTVEVTFRTESPSRMIALNADFLVSNHQEMQLLIKTAGRIDPDSLRAAAGDRSVPEILRIKVIGAPAHLVREAKAGTGPASDAPEEPSGPGDEFRRFSAFENDRRITSDGGLLPGTYGTTAADGSLVRTGQEAVRRYALPNPEPAKFEFVILPPSRTAIRRGIVQPAYGQPGGGVEVIFVNGSPSKTVTRGRTLPDS